MSFVSLGNNCTPRAYMKYNLQLTKENGYKSCPFDLCITPYSSLIECLKTDFEHFFDLSLIWGTNAEGDRSSCGKGEQNITNRYGMIFNHEGSTHSHLFQEGKNEDDFYIRNDFFEFKKRYRERIKNFKEYMKKDTITFIINTDNTSYDELKLIYPNKTILLKYI